MLCFGLCSGTISQCLWKWNSDPVLDSPGCVKHPDPTRILFRAQVSQYQACQIRTHHKLFSCPSFLSFLRQYSVRLLDKKKMAAGKHQEIHDVEHKPRRWFHSSRVKLPSVRMSASWILVSTYSICIMVSKYQTPLCGSGHCLTVGLLPTMIILITASLSPNYCAWNWEELAFVTEWPTFDNSSTSRLPLLFDLVLGSVLPISPGARVPDTWSTTLSFRSPHPIDRG